MVKLQNVRIERYGTESLHQFKVRVGANELRLSYHLVPVVGLEQGFVRRSKVAYHEVGLVDALIGLRIFVQDFVMVSRILIVLHQGERGGVVVGAAVCRVVGQNVAKRDGRPRISEVLHVGIYGCQTQESLFLVFHFAGCSPSQRLQVQVDTTAE